MFLGKYKLMLGSDCKLIYGTADYHRKRLKVLESERYIRRVNRLYIKLDDKGTRLVKEFGYDYRYEPNDLINIFLSELDLDCVV